MQHLTAIVESLLFGGASSDWADYPATRLFLNRLRAIHPQAAPDARQAAQIVTVCRLLDGDPLAIELAASSLGHAGLTGLGALVERHRKHRMRRNASTASATALAAQGPVDDQEHVAASGGHG